MIQLGMVLVCSLLLGLSMSDVRAEDNRLEVGGKTYFNETEDKLTKWDLKILVPPKGDGLVSVIVEDYTYDADSFFTVKKNGKTTFVVVLPMLGRQTGIFKTQSNFDGFIMLAGSYQRGGEQVRYSGDAYAVKTSAKKDLLKVLNNEDAEGIAKFAGTFTFEQGLEP